jgi:uncharacterized Tic20 family protein
MANRLQSWIFMAIALVTMGWGLIPIVRVAFGLDEKLSGSYIWSVSFLIGGLMCGLTAMLLMVRKQPEIMTYATQSEDKTEAAKLHACGLLIFTGIPLANFLACYFLWVKNRGSSAYLDYQGREAICFQISIYLYLMMCLFLAFIIVGALAVPLVLAFHLIVTLSAIITTLHGKRFSYPANISIIARTQI